MYKSKKRVEILGVGALRVTVAVHSGAIKSGTGDIPFVCIPA